MKHCPKKFAKKLDDFSSTASTTSTAPSRAARREARARRAQAAQAAEAARVDPKNLSLTEVEAGSVWRSLHLGRK